MALLAFLGGPCNGQNLEVPGTQPPAEYVFGGFYRGVEVKHVYQRASGHVTWTAFRYRHSLVAEPDVANPR